jgi:hypothetical protein
MSDPLPSSRVQRLSRLAAGVFLGCAFGLLFGFFLYPRLAGRDQIDALTQDKWSEAFERWKRADVRDYNVRVSVTGRQAATYAVEVRGGTVLNAMRDGVPLPQQRTWSTWTVEGMFETIARDLDSVDKHATGRADAGTPQLQLHATFHPQLGYPQSYLRTEFVRFAPNHEVSWTVVEFTQPTSADDGHEPASAP